MKRALILMVGAMMVVPLSAGGANSLPQNGKLAFLSNRKVFTSNAKGGSLTPIIKDRRAGKPSWSPDGRWVAIACGSTDTSDAEICIMRPNGSELTKITANEQEDYDPAWSPDGAEIVFVRDSALMTIDVKSGEERIIVTPLALPSSPTWSPDGKYIAVSAPAPSSFGDIYVVEIETGSAVNITNSPRQEYGPDWSPLGDRIAFEAYEDQAAGGWGIFTRDVDGSDEYRVTSAGIFATVPSWSPNGLKLTFSGYDDVGHMGSLNGFSSIFTIRSDGSDMRKVLRHNKRGYFAPDWQPR